MKMCDKPSGCSCGNSNVFIRKSEIGPFLMWYVQCPKCKKRGLPSDTAEEAVTIWNKETMHRMGEAKSRCNADYCSL